MKEAEYEAVLKMPAGVELDGLVALHVYKDDLKPRGTDGACAAFRPRVNPSRFNYDNTIEFTDLEGNKHLTKINREDCFYKCDLPSFDGALAYYWESRAGKDYEDALNRFVEQYRRTPMAYSSHIVHAERLTIEMLKRGFTADSSRWITAEGEESGMFRFYDPSNKFKPDYGAYLYMFDGTEWSRRARAALQCVIMVDDEATE